MISTYKYASNYQGSKIGNTPLWSTSFTKLNKAQLGEIVASMSVFGLVWILLCLI
ncbi:hypothetical protein GYA49_01680 [Candidatus Beckwithbacteria bacterium]|nr:hypothetical protein [Candidatus Beckwithbacteria bacterium]